MNKHLIIGISGPPRAGKDTVAQLLALELRARKFRWVIERMSRPLKEAAKLMLPHERFSFEENKDTPFILPFNTTFRSLQIDLYLFGAMRVGPDWLGRQMAQRISKMTPRVIVCPDFGRPEEVDILISSGHDVYQLQVYRPGTTYEGDSRVEFEISNGNKFLIDNSGDIKSLFSQAAAVANKILSIPQ